eukprot:CAMPEP_0197247526 /NCGR_PEP_ID=MMETSP1429-20130617/29248_1 /TAXON_ID=49237 /ORGANISM="Chaetoceros  sp., Strain UNC1202" /LENGTH=119 /DNA_ID=CAMNT_0042708445 /DNA_START=31 /DNA_END=390 /DNA_ORIENTATION=+
MSEAEQLTKKRKVTKEDVEANSYNAEDDAAAESEGEIQPPLKNDEGESYFDISAKKRFTVRKWKGKVLLDIREFYEDKNGEMKPGKKGISLTLDQYKVIQELIASGSIDELVRAEGGNI